MLKIEKKYLEFCDEGRFDPLVEETADKFLFSIYTDVEFFSKLIDDLRTNFDPRSLLGKLFAKVLVKNFKPLDPLFYIVALNGNDNLTISERRKELLRISSDFELLYLYRRSRKNDLLVYSLYLTECLRAEVYDKAYEATEEMLLRKYKNNCLYNFFRVYIDIFSGKEIDPQIEFDENKFGTFPFLSDVLYYIYSLREEDEEEIDKTLYKIKKEYKELYFLVGLGFCTLKVDITSLPKYSYCKTFGQVDPNIDYFEYRESIYNLIIILKISCEYCFKFFYQFEKHINIEASKFLNDQLILLSNQEKMLSVAIMTIGFQQFNTTNSLNIKISSVKRLISEAAKHPDDSEETSIALKYFDKFLSNQEEVLNKTLVDLENHGFIYELDFQNDSFFPGDELFIFTNVFTSGLMKAFKDNPSLMDLDDLTEFSAENNFDDDKPDHES